MIYFNDFVRVSAVNKNLLTNLDAIKTFDFLKSAEVIVNEIVFSKQNLPVVSGIAKDLERLSEHTAFPMSDETNRKVVGKMIKYILNFYGYSPKDVPRSEKRIRNFSEARYFKTSQIYHKTHDAKLKVDLVIRALENQLN